MLREGEKEASTSRTLDKPNAFEDSDSFLCGSLSVEQDTYSETVVGIGDEVYAICSCEVARPKNIG